MWLLLAVCAAVLYGTLYNFGSLFMSLVLVQVVERRSARFGFASCFALSTASLATALCSAAMESGHLAWLHRRLFACRDAGDGGANGAGHSSCSHRAQTRFFHVLFAGCLALLLLHVLLLCPVLLLRLVAQGALQRTRHSALLRGLLRRRRRHAHVHKDARRQRTIVRVLVRGAMALLLLLCCALVSLRLLSRTTSIAMTTTTTARWQMRSHDVWRTLTVWLRAGLRGVHVVALQLVHTATTLLRLPSEVALRSATRQAHTQTTTASADAAADGAAWARLSPLTQLLCLLTARVATLGVALAGLLAGYAAYAAPYSYCVPYLYWSSREARVRHALRLLTQRQRYVLELYTTKQRRIASEAYRASLAIAALEQQAGLPQPPQPVTHDGGDVAVCADNHRDEDDKDSDDKNSNDDRADGGRRVAWQRVCVALRRVVVRTPSPPAQQQQPQQQRLASHVMPGSVTARVREVRRMYARRVAQLRNEAESTRQLSLALYVEMNSVEAVLSAAQDGQTRMGVLYALLGAGLACYAALVLLGTVGNLAAGRRAAARDAVTTVVELLERALILRPRAHAAAAAAAYSNQADAGVRTDAFSVTTLQASAQVMLSLGLLLQAWLLVSSLRGLLLLLFRLTVSCSAVVTADTTALLFAMLMGVYTLSQLVLLRQPLALLLPMDTQHHHHHDAALSSSAAAAAVYGDASSAAFIDGGNKGSPAGSVLHLVLGVLPVHYYQRLNDWCFVAGLLATLLLQRVLYAESTMLPTSTLLDAGSAAP